MKKILAILLIISTVLSFASCGNERGDIEFPQVIEDSGNSDENSSYSYWTFESLCEYTVNNIVVATFNGTGYLCGRKRYDFSVEENVFGETPDEIKVCISNDIITFEHDDRTISDNSSELIFEEGKRYLLVLSNFTDVYSDLGNYYIWRCGLQIDIDNLKDSKMYNESLALHMTGDIDINSCTKEEFIEYICDIVEENKSSHRRLSDAETLKEAVEDSTDIIQVKIKYPTIKLDSKYKDTEIWECEITDILKEHPDIGGRGKAEIGKMVDVKFFADIVIPEKEYIVLCDRSGGAYMYTFTTKDSLRPVSEKAEIKSYID